MLLAYLALAFNINFISLKKEAQSNISCEVSFVEKLVNIGSA